MSAILPLSLSLQESIFEMLCYGKTFCIPLSMIASHLRQNPATDETTSIENVSLMYTIGNAVPLLQKYPF